MRTKTTAKSHSNAKAYKLRNDTVKDTPLVGMLRGILACAQKPEVLFHIYSVMIVGTANNPIPAVFGTMSERSLNNDLIAVFKKIIIGILPLRFVLAWRCQSRVRRIPLVRLYEAWLREERHTRLARSPINVSLFKSCTVLEMTLLDRSSMASVRITIQIHQHP